MSKKRLIKELIMVANKSDMFEYEEVNENMARSLAKGQGIPQRSVSAKNANGIDVFMNTIMIGIIFFSR